MRLGPGEFLGQPLVSLAVSGFTLTEYEYSPHSDLPVHEHEHAYLSFPLSGAYEEVCGRQSRTCEAGGAVFHPRGEIHRDRFHGNGAAIFSVELDDVWLDRLRDDGASCDMRRELSAAVTLRAKRLMRLLPSASSLRIEAAALDLLAELPVRRTHREPSWMRQVRQCLHDRPSRPSLQMLSQLAGVHPVHLARAFRESNGCTIGEYFNSRRIERATSLIGKLPLAELAMRCGFADQSHLCREFKRATGMSPAQFAKNVQ